MISPDELPVPRPGPGEVPVRVAATSFNPSEVGLLKDTLGITLPHTLGWDVAGTVITGAFVSITRPIGHPRAVHFVARNDPGQLAELVALIDKGVVDVEVSARPLAALADLHRAAERGNIRGKVTVNMNATKRARSQ
ncbi:alcohol dehydrogenase catalytic domain-containing protein [Nonomuraea sp. NPDC050394]|uniref:alcohol dehydrogenase catalytic domain-containing protein n=1 Tax=Nonomuraea sp. NPDC050394 TaxID=3364363 RepID=UPI0037B094EC